MVALAILIVLPLGLIAGLLGVGGGGSKSATTGATVAAGPAGSPPMTEACALIANLAQTSATDTSAPSRLLSDMQQAGMLATSAAQTDPAWKPMAADVTKLNTMVQSNTGDQAAFTAQLSTVAKECTAVVNSGGSPPPTTG